MKQTICICLFAAGLTIVGIIGVIGIKNDYRQPPEEDLTYAVETEKITETEIPELAESMAIPKDYAYVIFARDGVLVVYEKDCETEYFETNVRVSDLEEKMMEHLENGIYFLNEQELYDFLESYSS